MGVTHPYEPGYLVRLQDDVSLVLEINGMETEQDRAKHEAAKRWVKAANNWRKLGKCAAHVYQDPQMLGQELGHLAKATGG